MFIENESHDEEQFVAENNQTPPHEEIVKEKKG